MRLLTCSTLLIALLAPATLIAGENTRLEVPEGHVVELDCPQGSTRTIDPHETGPVRAPEACDRRVVEKPSDEKSESASDQEDGKKQKGEPKGEPNADKKDDSKSEPEDDDSKKNGSKSKQESSSKNGESDSKKEDDSENDEPESDSEGKESEPTPEKKLAANPFPELDLSGKAAAGGQAAFMGCLGYREDLSSSVFGRAEGCLGASPRSEAFLWGGQLQVGSPISPTFELGGFVDYTHNEAGSEGFALSGGSFIGLRYHDWLPVDLFVGPGVVRNSGGWAPAGTVGIRLGFSPFHGKPK